MTFNDAAKAVGAAAGAVITLAAVVGAWHVLNLPVPAWSQDVQRLEKQQLNTATEVYQQKLDNLTILGAQLRVSPSATDAERNLIENQKKETERMLEEIKRRRIELSK
jgi:hypothetical protein